MMAFTTPSLKNPLIKWAVYMLISAVFNGISSSARAEGEITNFSVEQTNESVFLSGTLNFQLSKEIEAALTQGIPIIFLEKVDVTQLRWFWMDEQVTTRKKYYRLSYQILSRRWRVNISTGESTPGKQSLHQNYETLKEALSSMQKFSKVKIASYPDIQPLKTYKVDYIFKLDASELPRLLQLGLMNEDSWKLSFDANQIFKYKNSQ